MVTDIKCPYCGGKNIQKGRQEMFPSTFMPETGGAFRIFKSLSQSREFDLYACMDCGYTSWFIKERYLEKDVVKAS